MNEKQMSEQSKAWWKNYNREQEAKKNYDWFIETYNPKIFPTFEEWMRVNE